MELIVDLELICYVLHKLALKHWRRFQEAGDQKELNDSIFYGRIELALRIEGHPYRFNAINNLGSFLDTRFQHQKRIEDIEEAIELRHAALGSCLDSHPNRSACLSNLAESLQIRFEQYGQATDLEEAIEHLRAALQFRPDGHPDRSVSLNNLAASLQTRFNQRGYPADLDEAIKHHRAALRLRPNSHPDRYASLTNLASALATRFQHYRHAADLDEAIELHNAGLLLCPRGDPNRSASLNNLANSLQLRFEQHGQSVDLDAAIGHHRAALKLRPDGHPDRSSSLYNLASLLTTRFQQQGQRIDLDDAIRHHRAALELIPSGHPNRFLSLNNLASALQTRFEQREMIADLNEAIKYHRAALGLCPDDHPGRPTTLGNLAISLQMRFQMHGRTSDLDDSVMYQRATLELRPESHPDRAASLNNLANSLQIRFGQYGRITDLDEAIEYLRAALERFPNSHPNRFASLNNLANSLQTRFEQNGRTSDLDEAVEHNRDALELLSNDHTMRPASLNNLAGSLQARFQQHGQAAALDESVELYCVALQQFPDGHPSRPLSLSNLADSLLTRFRQHGQTADLDNSINHHRTALRLCGDNNPNHQMFLNNLALSLQTRFERHGQTSDLDEAIEHHRSALRLYPDGHPDRSGSLRNLASSLLSRFKGAGLTNDFEECILLLEYAAEYTFSGCTMRLSAARQWATIARSYAHHTTSRAYRTTMLLLQRAINISPSLHAQHDFLSQKYYYRMLALDAAAYAIERNRLEEAIEILEQGRGLMWSQMHGLRTPLDHLEETNRALADRFRDITRQLENLITSSAALRADTSMAGGGSSARDVNRGRILFDEKLKLKRKLSNEQEELINEIRRIPGFERFLAVTPFKELQRAALEGPVIVINHCKYRCDALIILSDTDLPVVCVPLDEDFYKDSINLCVELLATRRVFTAGSPEYNEKLVEAMNVLWGRVVINIVNKLKELGIAEGARIWWCLTSVLSALPFHAAGPFTDSDGTMKYLLDNYVSSYNPTLGALINARSREELNKAHCEGDAAMLIVADTKSLKNTRSEILAVRNNTRSYISSHTILLNEKALRKTVIEGLQGATWIHFACHGHLCSESFGSSFKLSDDGLTLLDIIRANLPNAEFAFLSACHTAEQDGLGSSFGSYDEVLHLAAAVQFSGFQSVIGTMWELYDPDGPLLAGVVYSHMSEYKDGEVIHKRSAAALRKAALELRRRDGVQTERWVNLVHIGA